MPAATEMTSGRGRLQRRGERARHLAMICGLTASTTTRRRATAAALSAVRGDAEVARQRGARWVASGSATVIRCGAAALAQQPADQRAAHVAAADQRDG